MKRVITEKFDDRGNLIERVTVEEDEPRKHMTDGANVPLHPWTPIGPLRASPTVPDFTLYTVTTCGSAGPP